MNTTDNFISSVDLSAIFCLRLRESPPSLIGPCDIPECQGGFHANFTALVRQGNQSEGKTEKIITPLRQENLFHCLFMVRKT